MIFLSIKQTNNHQSLSFGNEAIMTNDDNLESTLFNF